MGIFAPTIGFPIIAIGIPLFCYRLIGREEAGLEAEQGEQYRAFMRAAVSYTHLDVYKRQGLTSRWTRSGANRLRGGI